MSPLLPSMPPSEAAFLRQAYREAKVILEYGSGGSTQIAAAMEGKYILSVESDLAWARRMRLQIAESGPASSAVVYHVDVGTTGRWGRPVDDSHWRNFHRYPNAIWDEPFFRHPDVVLIDGRFRIACMMAVMAHITRPVRVLFDDYGNRPKYRRVERLLRPAAMIGRMAEFHVPPGLVSAANIGYVISQYFDVSFDDRKVSYDLPEAELSQLLLNPIKDDGHEGKTQ